MSEKREPKPEWLTVPAALRAAMAETFGAEILDAEIAWGGYSPAASWRLSLADGRQVFVKGAHGGQTAHGAKALELERGVYARYPQLAAIAPHYLGEWRSEESGEPWALIALEAITPAQAALPWTNDKVAAVLRAFHQLGTLGLTGLLNAEDEPQLAALFRGEEGWSRFEAEARLEPLLVHFEAPDVMRQFIGAHLSQLKQLEAQSIALGGPRQPLHMDLRSDNVLFRADGRAVILDWPNLCFGPVVFDLTYFIIGVTSDGGGQQETVVAMAEDIWGERFDLRDWQIALANLSGYLANAASKDDIAFMPRLRSLQRRHLAAALSWLSRCLGDPHEFACR